MTAALTGFATGFSLILAIGAQNAFVLRQGLLRSHVFWLCLFCATSDALLIAAGVAGFGALVEALPALPLVMSLGGAAFLIAYGITRLVAAWRGGQAMEIGGVDQSLWRTLAIAAAFTWANPHVYLDTLGLIGAVSTQYPDWSTRIVFGTGAVFASFVFFFGLGYGARLIAPVMRSARAWQVLDLLIGLTMLAIAAKLIIGVI
ncbi:LysE/ArgO family amino acid transporter [Maritimibacter sp. UBA3975]|uniref:LysE/ArgO family amino acid transporter n=1 Tax=Maritimibacter sp. UBA3975 TaxID=1946833 RepID=UPI000C0AC1CD|nr:LysE/ArgO family amino acid transporter [Maritimibacter sp. UBA3975]MAM60517.1 amino acid transporter [Maritimibacter sp.]|tara:strand:+ start:3582 stop:4190 length:609 start_codon:yes stop_codon:yes gene_type:complete